MAAETTHQCPPDGSGLTPCCGMTPFELPRTDRITEDPVLVTCHSGASPVPAECPESKMDDGSHATDYEDSGSCPWCGKRNPDATA